MALLKKCLGIDLGTNSIKVAEVSIADNVVSINKTVSTELNIPAEASRSNRYKATVNALKGLLKANKISTKDAVFCVPGQTVFVRRFRLPKTSRERLERIIKYEARQQIPFPIDKTMVEYQIFPIEGVPEVDVFLVALKKDVLFDFMDLVNRMGLKPMGISVSTLSQYNFHSYDSFSRETIQEKFGQKKKKISLKNFSLPKLKWRKKPKKAKGKEEEPSPSEEPEEMEESYTPELVRAYLHIGSTITDLSIGTVGDNPSLGFTRSIPLAGNAISQAILDNCENVSDFQDAERIKKENTALLSMDAEPDPNINQEASEAVTAMVDRIIAELRRSLDFYISQPDGMAVDEIILTGGQSQIPNLASYIEEKLGIPVIQFATPNRENFKFAETGESTLTSYPISIGLGLFGLGLVPLKVDFLPPERKVAIKFKRKRGFVFALAAMLSGTIIFGAMCGDHYIAIYRDQTQKYLDEYRRNLPMINRVKDATEKQKDLQEKFDKLARGLTLERDYPLMRWLDILKAKPPDVLVSSMKIFPDGKIQIEGFTEDMNSAVNFTSNLNANLLEERQMLEGKGALLSNIKTEYQDLFKKDVSKFTINMKVKDRYSRVQKLAPPSQLAPKRQPRRRRFMPGELPPGSMDPRLMEM